MPNTTMNSLRNSITEMGARIREAASALAVAANDESISMEEVQRQQAAQIGRASCRERVYVLV